MKNNFETKDVDPIVNKSYLVDNLRMCVDRTGSYVAVSNNDKSIRIRDLSNG